MPRLKKPAPEANSIGLAGRWPAATEATPVEILSVDDKDELEPSAFKDDGENEQVECAGRPLQLRLIAPLKPLVGATVTLTVPELPLTTVMDEGEDETEKSFAPVTVN
jgi:hypothetical protein